MTEQDLQQISKLLDSKLEPMRQDITGINKRLERIEDRLDDIDENLEGLNIAIGDVDEWADKVAARLGIPYVQPTGAPEQ